MNRTLILVIGIIIALVVGVGAFFFISSRPTPSPTPTVSPQVQAQLRITVTPSAVALTASQSASFDVFLNTNGVKVDGFQFIANLDGANVTVVDNDPVASGTQIKPAEVTGLNPVTNSVVAQGTAQVIRFAMITQSAAQPFFSSGPIKVATVNFVPGTPGTIKLDFNIQNTRANKTGTTDETLITAASQTFTVNPALAATPSASPLAQAQTTPIACDAACLTDNDCSVGLSCVNNSCRAPACPSSSTCSCTGGFVATGSATPTATPKPATASATPTSTPKPTATASIAALPSSLPQSGSIENTFILIVSGLSLMVLAAIFMLRTL